MSDYVRLDYTDIKELEEKIKLLPNKAEYEINNYLWSNAGKILENEVYRRMPRSIYKKSGKAAKKGHARDNEALETIMYNLGVKVQTKIKPKSKDFGYLIFPNEGRGIKQTKKGAQEFFEKTLDSKEREITEGLTKHLTKKIEEEL